MRKIQTVFFGAFSGNLILAVAGFMGPAPHWPGIGGAVLAIACFITMIVIDGIDRRARGGFIKILNRYRRLPPAEEFLDDIDHIEGRVVRRDSLVEIAHDMGELRGKLLAKGMDPERVEKVDLDL